MSNTKTCTGCGKTKPRDEFYLRHRGRGDGDRQSQCKACCRLRGGGQTQPKINRNRARHRAIADLIERHEAEFTDLLEQRLAEARQEAEALVREQAAQEHYKDEPVRLRPGRRLTGQKAGDRIDVARCPHCVKHHDRGHVCPKCGMAPAVANRLPDDGHIDEVAVERAMRGDVVRLTTRERLEAIRRLAARGHSDAEIAQLLHSTGEAVCKYRTRAGIATGRTA
jgi:ribosomal protein L32